MLKFVTILSGLLLLVSCGPPRADRIVVGSKNFTEQLILGELIAQQIEDARRFIGASGGNDVRHFSFNNLRGAGGTTAGTGGT